MSLIFDYVGRLFLPSYTCRSAGDESPTDRYAHQASDEQRHNHLNLAPEDFAPSAPAFKESNDQLIDVIYLDCVEQGLFIVKDSEPSQSRWNLEACVEQSKPTVEGRWADLFDEVLTIAACHSSLFQPLRHTYQWRSHELHLIEGHRKPDVILVPKSHQTPTFSSILTYCEIKESFRDPNPMDASMQLLQVAGCTTNCQINRSFFLGAILCGDRLSFVLHARGNSWYSKGIHITKSPKLFLKAILALSSGIDIALGFDPSFILEQGPVYSIRVKGDGQPDNKSRYALEVTPRMYYRSCDMTGKGTKVAICKDMEEKDERFYALKETFVLFPGPNDVLNHTRCLEKVARDLSDEEERIFGEKDEFDIFRGNKETFGTRKWGNKAHLRGIPVLVAATVVKIPYYGGLVEDSMHTIMSRFANSRSLSCEQRIHYRTVSETCGVPMSWFSCRREFINAIMCAVSGHFNGLLKDLLHSDPSEANTWLCVDNPLNPEDAVPNWPEEDKDRYPKRSGVLGDWGMAELQSEDAPIYVPGGITGTYPFLAAELLTSRALEGKVRRQSWHDLEALFWVMWIVSITSMGPYHKLCEWAPPMPPTPPPSPHPDTNNPGLRHQLSTPTVNLTVPSLRTPADAVGEQKGVPLWATPGLHEGDSEAVFKFKREIPKMQFLDSMSPYWRSNDLAGDAFERGMMDLRDRFVWQDPTVPPAVPITHMEFITILKEMRDSIPAELDCHGASDEVIEEARARYWQLVQSGKDLGVQLLEVPTTTLLPKNRKSASAFPTATRLGMKTSSSKRPLEELAPEQGSDKRRRGRVLSGPAKPAAASTFRRPQSSKKKTSAGIRSSPRTKTHTNTRSMSKKGSSKK